MNQTLTLSNANRAEARKRITMHPDWQQYRATRSLTAADLTSVRCLEAASAMKINPARFLSDFAGFYVAPCRDISETDEETQFRVCEPGWAELWSVFGVTREGDDMLVHDTNAPDEAVRKLAQIADILPTGSVTFGYCDERYGDHGPASGDDPFTALCDDLSGTIAEELDELDDEDDTDDAFDQHCLTPIREAFRVYSDHHGTGTARNPWEPCEGDEAAQDEGATTGPMRFWTASYGDGGLDVTFYETEAERDAVAKDLEAQHAKGGWDIDSWTCGEVPTAEG